MVVWDSTTSNESDSSGYSVQGRRFRVTGDLHGTVFLDRDHDGIRDGGEPGIPGVTVELYDATLVLRRTNVTDASGDYVLRPKEGSWTVRFVRPSNGFTFTAQDAGGDDSLDSDADPTTGETDPFSISIARTRIRIRTFRSTGRRRGSAYGIPPSECDRPRSDPNPYLQVDWKGDVVAHTVTSSNHRWDSNRIYAWLKEVAALRQAA